MSTCTQNVFGQSWIAFKQLDITLVHVVYQNQNIVSDNCILHYLLRFI